MGMIVDLINRTKYVTIAIPASSSVAGSTWKSLFQAGLVTAGLSAADAEELLTHLVTFAILPRVAAGTDRAAFRIDALHHIAAGELFKPLTLEDHSFQQPLALLDATMTTVVAALYLN